MLAREHQVSGFLPSELGDLADLAIEEGKLDEARELCEEGLTLAPKIAATANTSGLLVNLAHIANLQGRHRDAQRLARGAVSAALDHEDRLSAASAAMQLAWALAEPEPERYGRLLGSAVEFMERAGVTRQQIASVCQAAADDALREQLDERAFRALQRDGRNTSLDEAIRDELETLNQSTEEPSMQQQVNPSR